VRDPRFTFTLHRLVAVLDRHADAILRRSLGITYSQFLFLTHLAGEDGIDGATLARRLAVSRAAISKRLPWFEERALIDVRPDPDHGRRRRIHLTERGRELAERAADRLEHALRKEAPERADVDLDALHDDLARLLHVLEAPSEPVPDGHEPS
jgi:DNA-binding MarR family transcriptional regulator